MDQNWCMESEGVETLVKDFEDRMKKTVYYKPRSDDIIDNLFACVYPINHTSDVVSNTRQVITSRVIRKEINGIFETENSIYVPIQLQEQRVG